LFCGWGDYCGQVPRIDPLTSLRFFAAFMVLAHHYWDFLPGYAGVGFFYVLSGFVLAYNYAGRVETREQKLDFWFRRFARVYPAHVLTLLFCLPLVGSFILVPINAVLLQSWFPIQSIYYSVNGPSWSISNEAFFYAVFPLLVGISGRRLIMWAAGLVILALAWTVAFPAMAFDTHWEVAGFAIYPARFTFYIFPPVRLLEFAIGMWLARLPATTFQLRHEAGALGVAATSVIVLPLLPAAFGAALFFIPASALLVHTFAHSEGPIAKLLGNRRLVLLGDASFMLYMIHWPLGQYLGHSVWVGLIAIGLSVTVYKWFERPVQKWLLSTHGRRRIEPAHTGY
jgi:peptidoglycan/LPS O-acetylase OafA/YrhL